VPASIRDGRSRARPDPPSRHLDAAPGRRSRDLGYVADRGYSPRTVRVDRESPQVVDVDPAAGTSTRASSLETGRRPDLSLTAVFAVGRRVVFQRSPVGNGAMIRAYG